MTGTRGEVGEKRAALPARETDAASGRSPELESAKQPDLEGTTFLHRGAPHYSIGRRDGGSGGGSRSGAGEVPVRRRSGQARRRSGAATLVRRHALAIRLVLFAFALGRDVLGLLAVGALHDLAHRI